MPRVRRGARRAQRRKKILRRAKGYYGARSRLYRTASESVQRGLLFAYRDRRRRKRDFRKLWIVRINAASRIHGLTYASLVHGLKLAQVGLDRKILADLAVNDPESFGAVCETARTALAAG